MVLLARQQSPGSVLAHIATHCLWCGVKMDLPGFDPWGIRRLEPVFCSGTCLARYQERMREG